MTAPEAAPDIAAPRPPRLLARGPGRLSAAARADRAAARLFLRAAAGAVGLDAAGVDARIRRRSRHHRAVCAGRHALHAEIPVGAAGRCAACAVLHARVRPPARLAGVLATAADRRDPAAGADRPGALAAVRRARRAAGRDDVRRRRTSWSTRFASRACPRASRPPAWRPMSRPIASACWSRPRARCSSSARSKAPASRAASAWMWGYVVMAALVLIGTVTALAATEPEQSARAEAATGAETRVHARAACRDRRVLRIPRPQGRARRRSPSWCCSNSPTRFPAP